jgi:hypothetical protein
LAAGACSFFADHSAGLSAANPPSPHSVFLVFPFTIHHSSFIVVSSYSIFSTIFAANSDVLTFVAFFICRCRS